MIPAIKSEIRKLLSVRSTYVIIGLCVVVVAFLGFYVEGYRVSAAVIDPGKLASLMQLVPALLSLPIALVGILLMTHEYRYNTIIYTLTAASSRLQVLFAKFLVVSVFAILSGLFLSLLVAVFTYFGLQLRGTSIVIQDIPYSDIIWRVAFYCWAYAMYALLFATVIRNQVGTISALLLLPAIIEVLLGLVLKENVMYLPFGALNAVLGAAQQLPTMPTLSAASAAGYVTGYIAIGSFIAALLFSRRDAN